MKRINGGSQYLIAGESHYQRNKQYYKDKTTARKVVLRGIILEVKKNSSCKDCGNSDYRVLEFDHQSNKEMDIAQIPNHGWSEERLRKEIAKCEIVCANCHRIRTLWKE